MPNRSNMFLVVLLALAALQPLSAQIAPDLFEVPSKAGGPAQAAMQLADQELPPEFRLVRSRMVRVDLSAINPDNESRPQRLRLNFFSDSAFEATEFIARRRANGEGFEWFGSLDGGMPAQAVLSVIDGRVNGSLGTQQAHYQIRHIEGDLHVIQEVLIDEPPIDDALVPDLTRARAVFGSPELAAKLEAPTTVNGVTANPVMDVLVCYTTQTRQWRGGSQAVRDRIQLAVSETNASFINSEIPLEYSLVGMVEIDGDGGSGLPERPTSEYIEDVTFNRTDIHELRDYYGADLVSVWVNQISGGVVGIGWVYQGGDFVDFPYSIVAYPYALGPSYTFAHESGHNMGGAHNREHAAVGGRYDYSYGYRKSDADPRFYSIMSYSSGCSGCSAVNHWSNPLVDIERNGSTAPSGVPAGASDSADIALTLINTNPIQTAYRSATNPPANNSPQAADQFVEVDQNSSVAITLFGFDPDSDPVTVSLQTLPTNGDLTGSDSAWTYTPQFDYVGSDSFEYHVHDSRGGFASATVSIVVKPGDGGSVIPPVAEGINLPAVTDQWQTITLTNTYSSPVIVCTPEYDAGSPPLVTRLRNVGSTSFDLRLGRFDKSAAVVAPTPARCLVVEEGVYTTAANGVDLDAVKFDSTVTDHDGSWTGESRTYGNAYSSPVVVGQVMSANDAKLSVFWSRGPNVSTPPTSSALFLGKTVNEDPTTARANETIGYIVTNAGVATVGTLKIEAGVKSGVAGLVDSPPYLINLTTTPSGAVLSSATMVGYNGGWPLLHGPNAVGGQQLRAAFDEDQLNDTERNHISEKVAYMAWTNPSGANQPPTAGSQALTTEYETSLPIMLTGSDPDLDPLAFAIDVQPTNGALSGVAPDVTYTPNALYSGPDSFTFSVDDGHGGVDQAVVSITVAAANQAPTADSQTLSTPFATALSITLTGSDPDLDSLTFAIDVQPTNGTLSGTAPNVTYTPNASYSGPDTFTFSVNDSRGGVDQAAVSISTGSPPPTTPPLAEGVTVAAVTDQWQTVTLTNTYVSPVIVCTPEYGAGSPPLVARLRSVGVSSFELRMGRFDTSTAAVVATPARCLIVEEGVYTVAANGVDLDAVKFNSNVTDHDASWAGHLRSYGNAYASPVVVGQVMSTNDANPSVFWARGPNVSTPPTSSALYLGKTVNEDPNTARADETVGYLVMNAGVATVGALTIEAGVKTGVAGLTDSPPYLVNLTTTPSGAVLSSATMVGYNGGWPLLYAPTAVSGQQLRTAFDEDQLNDTERNHIAERVAYMAWTNPSGVNQSPTADSQQVSAAFETALPITLTGSDPDLDSLTFAIDVQPTNGTLSGTAPNVTYTPNAAYSGPDSFTFSVDDSKGGVGQAVVSITVGAANQPPTADPQALNTAYETALPITLTGSDPDLDSLTFAIDVQPTNGTLSGTAPNVTYTPNAGYSGPDSFTFSVDDSKGGIDQAVVSITVGAGNQPPTADPQALNTAFATALPITLTGSDPDLDSLTFAIDVQPTNGTLSGTAPNVTYTPNAAYSGPDLFTFSVNDSKGGVDQAVVSITVGQAPPPGGGLLMEGLNIPSVTEQWRTIGLSNTYASPVIVCTPEYGAGSPPLTMRLRNVGSTSFDLRLGRFDGSTTPLSPTPARCFVVEEGVYTAAAHGVTLEAVKFNSTVTDSSSSWVGQSRPYGNAYASPAVVGQVMSTNDANPVSFWARGPDTSTAPTASVLFVGKTVNEDPIRPRANETIGYIVMEAGVATVGPLTLEAGVSGGISGYDDSPPYNINLSTTPSGAVLSGATMLGYNGGWPILYGPGAVVGQQLHAAFDEDQLLEPERVHLAETVAYLAWTNPESANLAPKADSQLGYAVAATPLSIQLTGADPDLEVLSFGVAAAPAHGSLSGAAPNVMYTADPDFEGTDSFTFFVEDNHGATDQAVVSLIVLLQPNNVPEADSQTLTTDYQTAVSLSASALDLDNHHLNFTIVDQVDHGSLTGTLPNLVYTPDAGFDGLDSFDFAVDDGYGGSDVATIWIAVRRPVNRQQIVISTADQLHRAFLDAAPGEEYLLASGVYAQPGAAVFATRDSGLLGAADAPIVFRAQNPANPPQISTLLLLQSPQYVAFHDIRFVNPPDNAHNINIYAMDGVAATDVTFEGCYFEGTPDAKARSNIKGTRMDNLVVRNSTFHGWGDSAIATVGLWNGLVENNRFMGRSTHNQRTGLQLKGDTRDVVVRNNYFENAGARVVQAGGGTESQFFRVPAEYEATRIDIYGNRIVGGDACFSLSTQTDSSFHHNTCYLPKVWIGRLLQESNEMQLSRNGRVEHNLFVYDRFINGEFTNVGVNILLETFTFDNNAFYQTDGDLWYFPKLPVKDLNIVDQIDPELIDAGTERMRIGSTNPVFEGIGADAVNPVE